MPDEGFLIGLPPGIAPVVPTTRPDRSAPMITVPGAPLDSGTHRMSSPPAVAPAPVGQLNADTITIRPTLVWRLDLPYGLPSVTLSAAAVLGRNPASVAAAPGAVLVALADPAKSVSKTHALVEIDGDDLWVTDLDSTNGTAIITAAGATTELAPGARTKVADGSTLALGEFSMRATRR